MASRPTSSRPTSTASSVRRNLFHHHLSRRPTAAATAGTASTTTSLSTANAAGHGASNVTTTTSASTATSKSAGGAAPATATALQEAGDDCHNGDIVVRNKNGEYDLEVPLMPIDRQDDRYEREKDDARLAEAVKYHCRNRNRTPSEPTELFVAVQASLRNTVASLHDDDWMYDNQDSDS